MSKLMSIWDLEFIKGKKISKKSPLVLTALRQIYRKKHFKYDEHEKGISLAEVLLTMYDINVELNKRRM